MMNGIPRNFGFVEEAREVHYAVLLGQERRVLASDNAAKIHSAHERRESAVPVLRPTEGLLNGAVGPVLHRNLPLSPNY